MLATLYISYWIHILLYMGSRIQATVKENELSSVVKVYVSGFHNDVMTCMLQIGTIHRVLVALVVSMEAIFSCLNLKHDGFLPYGKPEVFYKTGYDLTDIIIAWAEFKTVLYLTFFGQSRTYIYWVLGWNWLGGLSKIYLKFRVSSLA